MYRALVMSLLLVSVSVLGGCQGPPRSSRMTPEDYAEISSDISRKLTESRFLAERHPASPPIVVAIQNVENLSNDVIPVAAQWYMQARVLESISLSDWSRNKCVAFTMPAERLEQARRYGVVGAAFTAQRKPTHVMTATIYSEAWSSKSKHRTDLYYCRYEITDLATGENVWRDKVEFKRLAVGVSWD